ncbi:hypothetical protein JXA48_01700 [Candidatus Woesearchaeota archaeon]|nr:hypothetical protein [Candidatus Woesearchaeota archaeon]
MTIEIINKICYFCDRTGQEYNKEECDNTIKIDNNELTLCNKCYLRYKEGKLPLTYTKI